MRQRYIMTILIAVLFSLKGWTQLEIGMQNQQPIIPSWENYELMKYGKIGASMYTGTVNYSIPIYTYKDNDFEIPISINYATNGYRVNHSSGILGHGWSLSMPGIITRQVRDIPDEQEECVNQFIGAPLYIKGYMRIPQNFIRYDYYTVITSDVQPKIAQKSTNNVFYETEPDVFCFDFCGYHGSFSCQPNNKMVNGSSLRIYNAEGSSKSLKIELVQNLSRIGEINITDANGYLYHFVVGEFYVIENSSNPSDNKYVVTTWVLEKITAPNDRYIKFIYDRQSPGHVQIWNREHTYSPILSYYKATWVTQQPPATNYNAKILDQWKSRYRLKRIDFNDSIKMAFTYHAGPSERYYNMSTNSGPETHVARCDSNRLTNISVTCRNETIRNCDLDYVTNIPSATTTTSNCVTFLHSVDLSGEGRYSFEYNDENSNYPYLGTTESDHWGYYNGPDGLFWSSYGTIAEQLSYDSYYNESIIGNFKHPNHNKAKMGTLSKISYPTGGYSTLEYEPHTYSKQLIRSSQSGYYVQLQSLEQVQTAGGVRIKQVINHLDENQPADTVRYHYNNPSNNSQSSGILLNYPRYGIHYQALYANQHIKDVNYYNLSNFIYDYSRTHIEYSDISVTRSGGGTSCYKYSSTNQYLDHHYSPELYDAVLPTPVVVNNVTNWFAFTPDFRVKRILTPTPSYQFLRGRLLEESDYDKDGNIIRKVTHQYDSVLVGLDTCFVVAGEVSRDILYPLYDLFPASTTTKEYSAIDSVCYTESYEFNELGLISTKTTTTSEGNRILTKNTYVADTICENQVINNMKANHLLGKILKSETHRIEGNNDAMISGSRLTYYKPNPYNDRLVCPQFKEEWDGTQWTQTEHYKFNYIGNLVELTHEDSLTSTYLWGYGGRNLIAIIDNSTHNQTGSALSSLNLSINSLINQNVISDTSFGKLKSLGVYLPNSLQRLWRYKLLVGMTENVSPANTSDFFRYDQHGKLSSVLDSKSHLIEQYFYNILTQQSNGY